MSAKKILIVEDEDSLGQALVAKFKTEGFDVVLAKNGEEGIEHVINDSPDLIILDLLMPFKDGISFLDECEKNEACKPIPVIVLTNLTDTQHVSQSIEHGVREYLVKADWGISDIVNKVKEALK